MKTDVAISRRRLSRPLRAAIEAGLVPKSATYFDYGCGRGDDVRILRACRHQRRAYGWDPNHAPSSRKRKSDVVGLVYVLNVLPSSRARAAALRAAAGLARRTLIVAVRTDTAPGTPYKGGVRTQAGTYQRNYQAGELARLITRTLGKTPRRLEPGVYAVDMRG